MRQDSLVTGKDIVRAREAARAEEREACAKIALDVAGAEAQSLARIIAEDIAARIRARA